MNWQLPVHEGWASYEGVVHAEWIDANGHMNVARYDDVFDAAESWCFSALGIDEAYISQTRHGVFRLEKFISYQRELLAHAPIAVRSRILATDLRKVRMFHELWDRGRKQRAATMENLSIHVDLAIRRAVPVTQPEVRERLASAAAAHAALPWPDETTPPGNAR